MTDEAFRSLYGQYRIPLFRFAYRLTGSAAAAEDIVHDCFIGLFRNGFKAERGSQRTYLYAAIRNLSRKYHRDNGREDLTDDPGEVPDQSNDPLGAVVSKETSDRVRLAVESLPLLQREVLVLFEYEELPLEEIATIVDAELAAVKSRLHRARERLRKVLMPAMKGMTK
jgi:RNA polymerase sigma-70 factor (ECF subfamily)